MYPEMSAQRTAEGGGFRMLGPHKREGLETTPRGTQSCEIWTVIRVENIGQNINVIIFLACRFLNVPILCIRTARYPLSPAKVLFVLRILGSFYVENSDRCWSRKYSP
jgi:hypothetical protein